MEKKMKEVDGMVLYLEREIVKAKSGENTYNNLFVRGMLRGREVRADFKPADNGGYSDLDIAYGESNKKELKMSFEKMHDDKTGKTTPYMMYWIEDFDESEGLYKSYVKPIAKSDASIIEALIEKSKILRAKYEGVTEETKETTAKEG